MQALLVYILRSKSLFGWIFPCLFSFSWSDPRDSAWSYQSKAAIQGGHGMAKRATNWPGCLFVMLPGSGCWHWYSDGCQTGENICYIHQPILHMRIFIMILWSVDLSCPGFKPYLYWSVLLTVDVHLFFFFFFSYKLLLFSNTLWGIFVFA